MKVKKVIQIRNGKKIISVKQKIFYSYYKHLRQISLKKENKI